MGAPNSVAVAAEANQRTEGEAALGAGEGDAGDAGDASPGEETT